MAFAYDAEAAAVISTSALHDADAKMITYSTPTPVYTGQQRPSSSVMRHVDYTSVTASSHADFYFPNVSAYYQPPATAGNHTLAIVSDD